MSRNLRQKFPTAPRKVSKRRGSDSSSSLDLSDDGGYSGVEQISDSEDDDEEDVDAAEEKHIIVRSLRPGKQSGSPRPQQGHHGKGEGDAAVADDNDEDEGDDEDDADDDDEDDQNDDGDDENAEADVDDNGSWDGIVSDVDETASSDNHATPHRAVTERHVRFVDVPSSDSDSTETDDDHQDFFPDLFVDQNTLDPSFRREIECDDDDASSSHSGSFWDFHGVYEYNPSCDSEVEAIIQELEDEDTPVATPFPLQDAAEIIAAGAEGSPSVQELDGYETDGDTTEEEDAVPVPPVRRKTRRPTPDERHQSEDSDMDEPIKGKRGQPRVGRFNLDSSERKPIAVVNPISRKMMIFTPHRRRHLDLSPEQFNMPHLDLQSSPILSSSAHIMMSAMYSGNAAFGDMLNTQAMGPAEAFFPFPSEANTADESSEMEPDGEEDPAERSLDINDFLTFDTSSNMDVEAGGEQDDEDEDNYLCSDALASTPARPTTASSDADLLSHINASNVGAFRRDQINQRLILSEKATQDSLALSSPYNFTALRGIKSDRFETAAAPLTPMRRQKRHMQDLARSPLENASQKRKASSEHALHHKRHRSISDVHQLRI